MNEKNVKVSPILDQDDLIQRIYNMEITLKCVREFMGDNSLSQTYNESYTIHDLQQEIKSMSENITRLFSWYEEIKRFIYSHKEVFEDSSKEDKENNLMKKFKTSLDSKFLGF